MEINPAKCEHDRFAGLSAEINDALSPLGEVPTAGGFLGMDTQGRVYIFQDELMLMGDTLDEALENLLLGRKYKPNQ